MKVGDSVLVQVSASKTMSGMVTEVARDRTGKDQFVVLLENGHHLVMPDTAQTAKVIRAWNSTSN